MNSDWVVPAALDERRFCLIDVGNHHMQDTPYFEKILNQMQNGGREALLHELQRYDLTGIDLRNFPQTEALWEQKVLTMSSPTQFWYEKLQTGHLLKNHKQ